LAKKEKPFEYGNVNKECLIVAGVAVFNKLKKKTIICYAIHEAQLSRSTVANGVGCMPDENN
jgi:hypothetical protein